MVHKIIPSKILLVLCIILSSCSGRLNKDDKLTMERVVYNGNELRTDGYYYRYTHADNNSDPQRVISFFLYRNGIILGDVGVRIDEICKLEEWFRNGTYATYAREYKYQWGVFQIDGNQIRYEKWVPSNGPFSAVIYEGVILNDTTFLINKSYRMKDSYKKAPLEFHGKYHFKQFLPKPDSTNRFIK